MDNHLAWQKKLLHVADAAEDPRPCKLDKPRGSMYTSIVEFGPQNHNRDGLLGPNSIMVVYMDSLGKCRIVAGVAP